MASTFEEIARKAEVQLDPTSGENYGSHMERSLRGIGYALLAHAKAMEDIAKAIDKLAASHMNHADATRSMASAARR